MSWTESNTINMPKEAEYGFSKEAEDLESTGSTAEKEKEQSSGREEEKNK
jgi:hypothetical protein